MRAITTCVDYADLLALSLPLNARFFDQVVVVSTPQDIATAAVVRSVPNATLFTTDAFYRGGAVFRKWLALEEGLDFLGRFRDEWLVTFDADTIFPESFGVNVTGLPPGYLFSPRRRMLHDPRQYRPDLNWRSLPTFNDEECAGYCQIFHSQDPVLAELPWYGTDWVHAGGGDSDFAARWATRRRIKLKWHVLHLGPDGTNWCGRVTPRMDGSVPPEAESRAKQLAAIKAERALTGRNDHEKLRGHDEDS